MKVSYLCLGVSLLLLWIYLAMMEQFTPLFFLHDDNASSYIANFLFSYHTLFSTGRLAEINYFQYGGSPFLEQGQSAVLYPPSYLCVALAEHVSGNARWTIEWMMALHLTAGQIGLFCLLRSWRVEPLLAAIGGLLWVLSPFVVMICSNWVAVVYIVCYMPWMLLAIDFILQKPGCKSCLLLVLPTALFFLTGAIQFLAYVILFLGLYGLLSFRLYPRKDRLRTIVFLMLAAVLVFCIAIPMLAPMLHESAVSAHRSMAMPLQSALLLSVDPAEFLKTQFFFFGPKSLDDGSHRSNSSFFLCPEIFLLPLAWLGLLRSRTPTALLGFRLIFLAVLAFGLSTKSHAVLSVLPVFDHFRWPFKVFIYFNLFLLLGVLLGLSRWIEKDGRVQRPRLLLIAGLLTLILVVNWVVIGRNQFGNLLSYARLRSLTTDVASVIDPAKGRVLAVGAWGRQGYDLDLYLAYNFSTVYGIPNLGGYDPSIGTDQSDFAFGLNLPNIAYGFLNEEPRKLINGRCVRYLIVDTSLPNGRAALELDHIKILMRKNERVVIEDEEAAPMVICQGTSAQPERLTYSGNSLFIPIPDQATHLGVSLSHTDGWYYRCDNGPWLKPDYADDRVWCAVPPSSHLLEITYFDPYFRQGIRLSLAGILALGAFGGALLFIPRIRASLSS